MSMKTLIALMCGLSSAAAAQASHKMFVDPQQTFRLRYQEILVDCTAKQNGTSGSCGYCIGPGSQGTTKACFAYPAEKLKAKPMFVAAAFYVSQIESAKTQDACVKAEHDWLVIRSKGITRINGVSFATFVIGDNWAGSGQAGPAYRTFHSDHCYELGIQTVIARAAYDPDSHNNLTDRDLAKVDAVLKEALHSFVFLK